MHGSHTAVSSLVTLVFKKTMPNPEVAHDDDPIGLAEELPSQAGVRVFRVPVGQLVALAQKEILRGLENPHPVHAERGMHALLPLLEQCKILGAEAFELVLIPYPDCPPRMRRMRARALNLCQRWYIARLHNRLNNNPIYLIFPHAEGWQA